MKILIEHTTVTAMQVDITTLDVDAVVNAANATLRMGGGVAGAIKRAGGTEIEAEAAAQGPIRVGEAIVTSGGRLPARHVIHAATMGPDLATDEFAIRRATRNALARAKDRSMRSVALPVFGTGVGGFAFDRAADAMVEEIAAHIEAGTTLERVIVAVRGAGAEEAFSAALRRHAPPV